VTGGYFTVSVGTDPFVIFESIESKCRKPCY